MDSVLIIGKGGREHAIGCALNESLDVAYLWVSRSNAGLAQLSKAKFYKNNLENNSDDIVELCLEKNISLVVVGPERFLEAGIVDKLEKAGIQTFGPRMDAAIIETNKVWSKEFMSRHGIPTCEYFIYPNTESGLKDAIHFINSTVKVDQWNGIVVKSSSLCAGKGAIVCDTIKAAEDAINQLTIWENDSGEKTPSIIIEEKLNGYELSIQAVVDGNGNFVLLPPCQDHKGRFEGGIGGNTGGMGSICPFPLLGDEEMTKISDYIFGKTIKGLMEELIYFKGVLYAGLMISPDGVVNVLEFNCRFGDPETQSLLPILKTDLYALMKACCDDRLSKFEVEIENKFVSAVTIVVKEYPKVSNDAFDNVIYGIPEAKKSPLIRVYMAGVSLKHLKYYTSGGRVLTVCAKANTLSEAIWEANQAAKKIRFFTEETEYKADFRRDIGFETNTKYVMTTERGITYADAGVNIKKGEDFVNKLKRQISTNEDALKNGHHEIGGFGAVFDLKKKKYFDPLLISGTDGVGTKLLIAKEMNSHCGIGKDLVAMCVNDIMTCGAEPLFFLDYFACGELDPTSAFDVVSGINEGCKLARCPLIGGETAEMPGMYQNGGYELAGFAVGAVERTDLLPKMSEIGEGDLLMGFGSSGVHSNGFSLIRKILTSLDLNLHSPAPFDTAHSLGDILLTPTIIYTDLVPLIQSNTMVRAVAHITGGGLVGNISRILPGHLKAVIDTPWTPPDIFLWLMDKGISWSEMVNTFNMGIGLVVVIKNLLFSDKKFINAFRQLADGLKNSQKFNIRVIGRLEKSDGEKNVVFRGILENLLNQSAKMNLLSSITFKSSLPKKRVAVLISGVGTNLKSLIAHAEGDSLAEISLVISNVPDCGGIELARMADIPVEIIMRKKFHSREDFDMKIQERLIKARIDYVCLAGFMEILSTKFVNRWTGKMLNIHPSLLPYFKGINAQQQALDAGVFFTGCTVHFVSKEVDSGKILGQQVVPVLPKDTVESLSQRIKKAEHKLYPRMLEALVRGNLKMYLHPV